jgi:hypothetical protein
MILIITAFEILAGDKKKIQHGAVCPRYKRWQIGKKLITISRKQFIN